MEQIEAEYYVLLNSDVEVAHHWLAPLVEFMDNHPEAAACQPKLLSEKDHDSFEYAGASGGYLDRYGYPFVVAEFLILLRLTTDNMITMLKCCGLREHV